MGGLKKKNVELDRKMLSELAIHHPDDFSAIVEWAKAV
jgi:large subunit ribosomal protein L20